MSCFQVGDSQHGCAVITIRAGQDALSRMWDLLAEVACGQKFPLQVCKAHVSASLLIDDASALGANNLSCSGGNSFQLKINVSNMCRETIICVLLWYGVKNEVEWMDEKINAKHGQSRNGRH